MTAPYSTRDVSSKPLSLRTAQARATLKVASSTIEAIRSGSVPKADPIGVAKVAGIQAAKQTSLLIPYCHQVPLDLISVDITMDGEIITVTTNVKAIWKTGVEMEALLAASTAALTLYDMLKIIDSSMQIVSITLLQKTGGKSNDKHTGEGLTAAVLVMSDSVSQGTKEDTSGKYLVEQLKGFRFKVTGCTVLPDEQKAIEKMLKELADQKKVDMIVTTGGTGVGPRDVTPEATLAVIERRLEGVEETLNGYGQERISTAMLSRGIVGIRGKSLIINLPGSKRGVEDGLNALFPGVLHTFKMMRGEGH